MAPQKSTAAQPGDWYAIVDAPECACRREGELTVFLFPGTIVLRVPRSHAVKLGFVLGEKCSVDRQLELHSLHAHARDAGRILYAVRCEK